MNDSEKTMENNEASVAKFFGDWVQATTEIKPIQPHFLKIYSIRGLPEDRDIRRILSDYPGCEKLLVVHLSCSYSRKTDLNIIRSLNSRILNRSVPCVSMEGIVIRFGDRAVCRTRFSFLSESICKLASKRRTSEFCVDYPTFQTTEGNTDPTKLEIDLTFNTYQIG